MHRLVAPRTLESPEQRFGFAMGADRRLVRWGAMLDYFRALSRASDRLKFDEIGHTTEGRPFVLLTISDPDNLARLPELIEIQARLADARTRDSVETETLIERGRAICLVTCSIHATEVGGTQMTPELVFRLLCGDDPVTKRILEETVLLLVPSLNPDGMELVNDWYERTVGGPYEGNPPPALYHPYAGHDNNRDWFMQTLIETRLTIRKIHNVWRPHIVFDLHQMQANGPRYVVPPFVDPYDPNVDPLIQAQINVLGTTMAAELTAENKPGVATSIIFDAFSPSRSYQHYHGGVRILSEAASAKIATPVTLTSEQLVEARGFDPRVSTQNHPVPWPGGTWRLRDIVDYNLTATWTVLDHAARFRDRWLRNFAAIQDRAIEPNSPFAFLVPKNGKQRDPGSAAELLQLLRAGDVEIQEAVEDFTADGVRYPAGTYVIEIAQPFGRFAKTLLEVQHYPDLRLYPGGPPKPPYDITAHTMPLQMDVEAIRVAEPFQASLRKVEIISCAPGGIREQGEAAYLVAPTSNAAFRLVNHLSDHGASIGRIADGVTEAGAAGTPGTFVVTGFSRNGIVHLARSMGVMVDAVETVPGGVRACARPRLGLYHSWRPNAIDAGWTRLVLEDYDFSHALLRDRDLRQGNLRDRFDAIVLPSETSKQILEGNSPSEYPVEYSGGIGDLGAANLRRFVEAGGTLIALDAACEVAVRHLYLPVSNILEGVGHDQFYSPGSLLRLIVDPQHPIGWGYQRETVAMFVNSPAFEVSPTEAQARVVASYPHTNQLLSGWIRGPEHIAGRAALVECQVGAGRAVLFGFRPQFRHQCRATYRLLFNAIVRSTMESAG